MEHYRVQVWDGETYNLDSERKDKAVQRLTLVYPDGTGIDAATQEPKSYAIGSGYVY